MLGYVAKVSAAILCVGLILPMATLYPRAGEQVAVVFPPWIEDEAAAGRVRDAGGVVVSTAGSTIIAAGFADNFFYRLLGNGAVLILDAKKFAALCGPASL